MNPGVIGVFIPIVLFLVLGLVFVSYYYFRYRERQMLIEKGLDAESIKQFFDSKKDPNRLLKLGVLCVFFGIGLGVGLMLQDYLGRDYYVPFSLFTITGIGFVVANLISKKYESKDITK